MDGCWIVLGPKFYNQDHATSHQYSELSEVLAPQSCNSAINGFQILSKNLNKEKEQSGHWMSK